ncbi:hypothetical protein ACJJTC_007391 [Scirpophaga incertulas]
MSYGYPRTPLLPLLCHTITYKILSRTNGETEKHERDLHRQTNEDRLQNTQLEDWRDSNRRDKPRLAQQLLFRQMTFTSTIPVSPQTSNGRPDTFITRRGRSPRFLRQII